MAIRKAAFANGKQRDNEWMADLASICLQDEAVGCYEHLDAEVQRDWTQLSRQLPSHWDQEVHESSPAPAGAAPGRDTFNHLPMQASGVVKVISHEGTNYLSRTLITSPAYKGVMQITDKLDDAVRVTFQRSDGVHEIRFENDFSSYPLLGFHFVKPNLDLYTESNQWGCLTSYQVTSTGSILMPPSFLSPTSGRRAAPSQWRVGKDGIMRPYVVDDHIYSEQTPPLKGSKT